MAELKYQPKWWQRSGQAVAWSRPGAWLFSRTFPTMDRTLYKLSQGRVTVSSSIAGLPLVMLTTTGAKSGQPRTVPLIGIPDSDDIVLIASNWGGASHPSWYYNLRAYPEVTVAFYGQPAKSYVAREASGAERDAYWQKAVSIYRGYDAYKQRTRGREIPILVLTPQGG